MGFSQTVQLKRQKMVCCECFFVRVLNFGDISLFELTKRKLWLEKIRGKKMRISGNVSLSLYIFFLKSYTNIYKKLIFQINLEIIFFFSSILTSSTRKRVKILFLHKHFIIWVEKWSSRNTFLHSNSLLILRKLVEILLFQN